MTWGFVMADPRGCMSDWIDAFFLLWKRRDFSESYVKANAQSVNSSLN